MQHPNIGYGIVVGSHRYYIPWILSYYISTFVPSKPATIDINVKIIGKVTSEMITDKEKWRRNYKH